MLKIQMYNNYLIIVKPNFLLKLRTSEPQQIVSSFLLSKACTINLVYPCNLKNILFSF